MSTAREMMQAFFSELGRDGGLDRAMAVGPLDSRGLVESWNDSMVSPGQIRHECILQSLAASRLAVLLVSSNFLASSEIQGQVPPGAQGRGRSDRARVLVKHAKATMKFYFDYISPYAYLAWKLLPGAGLPVQPEPIPVLFAGLLQAHGNVGPAEVESKRRYVFRDVARRACHAGIPLRSPPSHPYQPLLSLRVTCAALESDSAVDVIDALFDAVWRNAAGVETVEQVRAALAPVSVDSEALIELAGTPRIKAQLRSNTEDAVAMGIFGVPSFWHDGELFWGADSIAYLRDYLSGTAPQLPDDEIRIWDNLRATAERKNR